MAPKDILLVGNWKSNPATGKEAEALLRAISKIKQRGITQVICPPAVFLLLAKKYKKSSLLLGAQDVSAFGIGPHTGDISAEVVADAKAAYAIVGHSERRSLGETDEVVGKKTAACLANKIIPIICIGEAMRDEAHQYLNTIREQLAAALAGVPKTKASSVVIAYEPVWAIGAGAVRGATPEEFQEMAIYVRKILSDMYGDAIGKAVRVIYGGSSDEKNAQDFIIHGGAQGFLVGRVSLVPKRWEKMVMNIFGVLQ